MTRTRRRPIPKRYSCRVIFSGGCNYCGTGTYRKPARRRARHRARKELRNTFPDGRSRRDLHPDPLDQQEYQDFRSSVGFHR